MNIINASLLIAGLLSVSFSDTKNHTENPEPEAQNILFIAVDDLKPALGSYGDPLAITPNIDRIAENGTLMASNYCQQAICAPSRISLFTGLRPDQTGVLNLQTFMRDVNPDILTLPEYFASAGYQTAGLGKLMHGAKNNDPQSWTIPYKRDQNLNYASGYQYPANGKYQSDEAQKVYEIAQQKKLSWKATNILMKDNGVAPPTEFLDIPDDAYTDGAIAKEGIRLLKEFKKTKQPFFLALGFNKPHLPFVAPKKYYDLYENVVFKTDPYQEHAENSPAVAYSSWGELRNYSGIPATGGLDKDMQIELIRSYYACVSYVDAQIGLVMKKLKELGLAENTIVVIWGDHGWHLGDHGLWCKHTNFEQATKSPLIFSAPGYKKGQITHSMTEFTDVFPSLCDLAGIDIPKGLPGKSLKPLMINPGEKVKEFSMSQYPRENNIMGYSLRTERYRLTWWLKLASKDKDPAYTVEAVELYDYKTDPHERVSLAGSDEYKNIEKDLSSLMREYLKSI